MSTTLNIIVSQNSCGSYTFLIDAPSGKTFTNTPGVVTWVANGTISDGAGTVTATQATLLNSDVSADTVLYAYGTFSDGTTFNTNTITVGFTVGIYVNTDVNNNAVNLSADISGGTLPFTIAWTDPNGYGPANSNIFSSLILPIAVFNSNSNYSLTVTDSSNPPNQCTALQGLILTPNRLFVIAVDQNGVSYGHNSNVYLSPSQPLILTAQAVPSTGTGQITYEWYKGTVLISNTSTVTIWQVGHYHAKATDSVGNVDRCYINISKRVNIPF